MPVGKGEGKLPPFGGMSSWKLDGVLERATVDADALKAARSTLDLVKDVLMHVNEANAREQVALDRCAQLEREIDRLRMENRFLRWDQLDSYPSVSPDDFGKN